MDQTRSYKRLVEQLCRSSGDTRRVERELSVYDIVLCVYERFRVDGDKNMRLLAFAFTIVFVWTGLQIPARPKSLCFMIPISLPFFSVFKRRHKTL